ncbi:hypothetical protein ABO04_00705 [Nitrosomonas sp. HPC101]|uniref:hypothetical protein n=1 Tax=Nitrosomonas sp. HPC101 TaxID=1658667 RepID=UPI00136BB449|nr:hypothetical protein [Nitrosomonas sp. HPC101]MXS84467.1 hypothetical protein [Nitrosomonas sp. HPC101]
MGALFFYTFIYFVGHYSALGLNIITNKKLLNHRLVGLIGVILVAIMHAYKIISSTGHDEDTLYAVSYFVIFPVVVISAVLVYLSGKDKNDNNPK